MQNFMRFAAKLLINSLMVLTAVLSVLYWVSQRKLCPPPITILSNICEYCPVPSNPTPVSFQPYRVTDSHWRHFYFHSTSVFSALEVCYENSLYKFTFDVDIDVDMDDARRVINSLAYLLWMLHVLCVMWLCYRWLLLSLLIHSLSSHLWCASTIRGQFCNNVYCTLVRNIYDKVSVCN